MERGNGGNGGKIGKGRENREESRGGWKVKRWKRGRKRQERGNGERRKGS
jgi:hypothetical protein